MNKMVELNILCNSFTFSVVLIASLLEIWRSRGNKSLKIWPPSEVVFASPGAKIVGTIRYHRRRHHAIGITALKCWCPCLHVCRCKTNDKRACHSQVGDPYFPSSFLVPPRGLGSVRLACFILHRGKCTSPPWWTCVLRLGPCGRPSCKEESCL